MTAFQKPEGLAPAIPFAGELGVLNVGTGDTKLTFDKDKPIDRERAARIVQDMLSRGYAILVQVGEKDGKPLYLRAEGFDPETCEYLIVGLSEAEEAELSGRPEPASKEPAEPRRKRGREPKSRVPAESTRAVAVARSAGG